jgi:pimeloyl-ACP methyl ester carboxylesterase
MLRHIPVEGGSLAVDVHAADTAPVLALHGVSSNRKLWNWAHATAPGLSLITPDLRGRADSVDLPGPSSLRQHADDMIRVLDALEIDTITVCGLSMGGFVGVALATAHPDRVSKLVLVDGGFPMAGNDKITPDMVPTAFGGHLATIERVWSGPDEYVAAQAAANSLLSADDPLLRDYLTHFIVDGRVRIDPDALLADVSDVLFGPSRWTELTVPTWLVYAEWGVDRDSAPAYPPESVAGFQSTLDCLGETHRVLGVDHGGLLMTPTGAAEVVRVLDEVLR